MNDQELEVARGQIIEVALDTKATWKKLYREARVILRIRNNGGTVRRVPNPLAVFCLRNR